MDLTVSCGYRELKMHLKGELLVTYPASINSDSLRRDYGLVSLVFCLVWMTDV